MAEVAILWASKVSHQEREGNIDLVLEESARQERASTDNKEVHLRIFSAWPDYHQSPSCHLKFTFTEDNLAEWPFPVRHMLQILVVSEIVNEVNSWVMFQTKRALFLSDALAIWQGDPYCQLSKLLCLW